MRAQQKKPTRIVNSLSCDLKKVEKADQCYIHSLTLPILLNFRPLSYKSVKSGRDGKNWLSYSYSAREKLIEYRKLSLEILLQAGVIFPSCS